MKCTHLAPVFTTTLCLALTASALSNPIRLVLDSLHLQNAQTPLTDPQIPVMPPGADDPNSHVSAGVILSDVLGKAQDIAIFSGLTRDIDSVSDRLDDGTQNATVLAPNNGVMRALKRKPWEDPNDYDTFGKSAYDGKSGEDRAHRNLRRFVEQHIVPESPWKQDSKVKTLAGNEVWWEVRDGKKLILPAEVEVTSIADKVGNGEVWIINGALN